MIHIDTSMFFNPPFNCRERRGNEYPRQIVLHWNGANSNTRQVHNTLKQRGLSYHFIINKNGKTTQLVSCGNAAFHAGKYNGDSIGICLISRGFKRFLGEQNPPNTHLELIKGREFLVYDYTENQKTSLVWLVDHLCNAYKIPKTIYTEPNTHPNPRSLNGIIGHMHCSQNKVDPGLEILNYLERRLK